MNNNKLAAAGKVSDGKYVRHPPASESEPNNKIITNSTFAGDGLLSHASRG